MNEDQAKIVALRALAYLVGDDSVLQRFMGLSGIDPSDLRQGADDPAILAGVLEFFLGNEAQLLEMCRETGMAPEEPAQARHGLTDSRHEEWS
ncbi:MAG: DUF3572 domain-containing protein [Alphaproteobacteria bacterium]|jgi:hypothetical protein|nr:DUF3572 domain-containing protein [Alphaproteobacteria bacterium]MDP6832683.1 DUF3572 domain-containing protein [Alphaproteobacteria bacterium]MDP6875356.1 DUF3572 domain-containing protein [Alphaproteobacteria bacterium]